MLTLAEIHDDAEVWGAVVSVVERIAVVHNKRGVNEFRQNLRSAQARVAEAVHVFLKLPVGMSVPSACNSLATEGTFNRTWHVVCDSIRIW